MKTTGLAAIALLLTGCPPPMPVSQGPGCHYVMCSTGLMGIEKMCAVRVDQRWVSEHETGQEALDFIKANGLRTCAGRE